MTFIRYLALALFLVSCSGAEVDFARSLAVPQPADIVLRNGKIVTVDRNFSIKEAVAIKGGRFLAVGSDRDMRPFTGPMTRVIDLGRRTVIPGLIDAQIHATQAGLNWDGELHWEHLRSLTEGLKTIAKATQNQHSGSWIIVAGGWVPTQFVEQRFPTIAELDAIAPNHPVYLQYLGESALLNSAGLRAAGITAKTAEPGGGRFERTPNDELTGWLRGVPAWRFAYSKIPKLGLDRARQSLRACFSELNRFGITSVADLHGNDVAFAQRRVLADMARVGELNVRINFYIEHDAAWGELTQLNAAVAEIKQLPQSDWFRFGGFALNLDQRDVPAASAVPGSHAREAFRRMKSLFTETGASFRLSVRDDSEAIQSLAELEQVHPAPTLRQRIAFTAFEGGLAETIERIKKLGAGIIVKSRAASAELPLESQGVNGTNATSLNVMFGAGLPLAIGSNGFLANNFSPMLTLEWLVTGKNVTGTVSREQALRMHTMGGAWLTAESQRKGSIEVDKFADLVVLSGDYLTIPEDQIRSLESMLTMVGGRVVYFAQPFGPF